MLGSAPEASMTASAPSPRPAEAMMLLGVLLGRHALGEVGVGGGEVEGEIQLGLDDVHGDDGRRTEGLGHGGAEQADRAGAHDDDALARLDGRLLGDVDADREGSISAPLLQETWSGSL